MDYNNLTGAEGIILSVLLENKAYGKEFPVKSSVISGQTGFNGIDIRSAVNSMRCKGTPVCSGNKGYYLAMNETEVWETINQLECRIMGMQKAIYGLKQSLT
jgi:biotin operon repressor